MEWCSAAPRRHLPAAGSAAPDPSSCRPSSCAPMMLLFGPGATASSSRRLQFLMAEASEQPSSDPPTPPQDTNQTPKKNKRGRTKKAKRAACAPSSSGATMVEDPFLVLAGGKEGGFLELEEIDGADFGIFGSTVEDATDDNVEDCKNDVTDDDVEEGKKGEKKGKKKRIRKKRKLNDEKDTESKEDVNHDDMEDMQDVSENMEQDNNDELKSGEDELYAWLELRLHPLLIKAMHRLGFEEPTPIQKACIPAGAHQGKAC